jgi:surface antigen
MKRNLLSAMLFFAALCINSPILAALSSSLAGPFGGDEVMSITWEDASIMKSNWEELRDNNLVGVKKEWNNPENGRSGSMEVLKNFTDEEGSKCKQMRYKFARKGFVQTYTFMMDRCLVSDGKWKFK